MAFPASSLPKLAEQDHYSENDEKSEDPPLVSLSSLDFSNSHRFSGASIKEDLGYSRFGILAIALICSVWSAGLIFGWAPLYGTLLRAGVYEEYCEVSSAPIAIILNDTHPDVYGWPSEVESQANETQKGSALCLRQQERLNLIYTAGSAFTQASLFISGIILDWQGPKFTTTASSLIVSIGSLLFGFSALYRVDLYIVGFAMMGFGGAGINLATYTVSNLFPSHKSWVVSALVGVWTLSSLWFLLFRPAFNAGFALHSLFFAQAGLLVITATIFLFTFPSRGLREGERFSFRQWLPWNANAYKHHHAISNQYPRHSQEIQLQTFHDLIKEESQYGKDKTIEEVTNLKTPKASPTASDSTISSRSASQLDLEGGMDEPVLLVLGFEDLVHHSERISSGDSEAVRSNQAASNSKTGHLTDQESEEKKVSLDLGDRPSFEGSVTSSEAANEMMGEAGVHMRGLASRGLAMAKAVISDVLTVDFVLLTVWFAIHVLFFEFYIGTLADALDHRTRQQKWPFGEVSDSEPSASSKIDLYVTIFNFIYAFGFLFVPIYAWATDTIGFVGSFLLATLFAFSYPLVSLAPWLPSQFIAYTLYSAGIQFVYSCQFGFVAYRFGYENFGALVGIMGLVTACLIPLQPVFLQLVLRRFHGNFFFMYLIQACVTLPLFSIVLWNYIASKRIPSPATPKTTHPK